MTNAQRRFEVVDDDPNFDYEYWDTHDFGDEMEEADKRGELYTAADLGCTGFSNICRKLREIKAAKKKNNEEAAARPYPYPHQLASSAELCCAEEPGPKYQ